MIHRSHSPYARSLHPGMKLDIGAPLPRCARGRRIAAAVVAGNLPCLPFAVDRAVIAFGRARELDEAVPRLPTNCLELRIPRPLLAAPPNLLRGAGSEGWVG